MSRKTDQDMPIGRLTRVKDILPPPSELVEPRQDIKVTLALTSRSLAFFKEQAKRNHTKYQRMIRELVDKYASHYAASH